MAATREHAAKWRSRRLGLTICARGGGALLLAAIACGRAPGKNGDTGPEGPAGPTGPVGASGPAGDAGTSAPGIAPVQARLYAQITAVSIPNAATTGGAPTVTYKLFLDPALTQLMPACKGGGDSGYAGLSPNFTIAKLVADTQNTGIQRWQSYINKTLGTYTVATLEGGHNSYPGKLTDNGDGSCSYKFVADLSVLATPSAAAAVTVAYEPAAITRFGLQDNPTDPNVSTPAFDGFADVVASTGAIQAADPRMLISDAACNSCHSQIAHHGGKRLSTGFCVSCHNAGTPDPDPGHIGSTSLDMSVMIHKIHQGGRLPSVTGVDLTGTAIPGAVPQVININGTDYSAVKFPQDTGNCTACHNGASGTGSDYWKKQISIEACTACHDRTSLTGPQPGFVEHTNGAFLDGTCNTCHAEGKPYDATLKHALAVPTLATQKATLTILGVTGSAPGSSPVIKFAITDPTNANGNEDLATNALWTTAGARLALDIVYSEKAGQDWTNTGNGAVTGFGSMVANGSPAPGQPASFDLLAGLKASSPTVVKNSDGTYTFTSGFAIPAGAVGSGVAVLEGHPNSATGGLPVRSGTFFFPITDAAATPRRAVVDIQKCDKCHGLLSLHGGNRTDNIDTCVSCHNTEATDVTQRPQPYGTPGIDGKPEQSIAFSTMIHSIHTGASPYSPGIVVYAYTGKPGGRGTVAPTDFRQVVLPEGNSIGKCGICHADTNPLPSADNGIVNGIAQITADSADQTTFKRTSKTAAVCSSCHGTTLAAQHMSQNGAGFGLTQIAIDLAQNSPYGPGAETCSLCHGKGAAFDPALFHGH